MIALGLVHLLKCIGIMVLPLDSIAEEMKRDFPKCGVRVLVLCEATRKEVCQLLRSFKLGKDGPVMVLTSPESLLHKDVLEALAPLPGTFSDDAMDAFSKTGKSWSELPRSPVGVVIYDEAHSVCAWGHDFRVDYQRLLEVAAALRSWRTCALLLVALTATATPAEREYAMASLGFRTGNKLFSLVKSTRRLNITYQFRLDLSSSVARGELKHLVLSYVTAGEPVLVFVGTRSEADTVAESLDDHLFEQSELRGSALPYRGGLQSGYLNWLRADFAKACAGDRDIALRVLVCTERFGMGVNIKGLRRVIICNTPTSPTQLVQRALRAGRGGEESTVHVFVTWKGRRMHKSHALALCTRGQEEQNESLAKAGVAAVHAADRVYSIAAAQMCRHASIDTAFGAAGADPCGDHCDVCCDAVTAVARAEPALGGVVDNTIKTALEDCTLYGKPDTSVCRNVAMQCGTRVSQETVRRRVHTLILEGAVDDAPPPAGGGEWILKRGGRWEAWVERIAQVERAAAVAAKAVAVAAAAEAAAMVAAAAVEAEERRVRAAHEAAEELERARAQAPTRTGRKRWRPRQYDDGL